MLADPDPNLESAAFKIGMENRYGVAMKKKWGHRHDCVVFHEMGVKNNIQLALIYLIFIYLSQLKPLPFRGTSPWSQGINPSLPGTRLAF